MTLIEKRGFKEPSFDNWYNARYGALPINASEILAMKAAWSGCNRLWKGKIKKYIRKTEGAK